MSGNIYDEMRTQVKDRLTTVSSSANVSEGHLSHLIDRPGLRHVRGV